MRVVEHWGPIKKNRPNKNKKKKKQHQSLADADTWPSTLMEELLN
jgi:hypothetical protein